MSDTAPMNVEDRLSALRAYIASDYDRGRVDQRQEALDPPPIHPVQTKHQS